MEMEKYRLINDAMGALIAIVLVAALIAAAVTSSRNGRSSMLAAAGCAVLLGTQLVYFFGTRWVDNIDGFTIVTVLGGFSHLGGVLLLLAAALLPRTPREDPTRQSP